MAKTYRFGREVSGILFKYDVCEHCGKLPTEHEILDQLSIIRNEYGASCAVCGKKAQVTEAVLLHYKQGGVDRWGGEVTAVSQLSEVTGNVGGRHVSISIHPECAKAALPYAILDEPHPFCGQCSTRFKDGDHKTWGPLGMYPHPICDACVKKNLASTYTNKG